MSIFSYIIFLLIFIAGLIFAFLNHNLVTLNYYFGNKQLSLSLLLIFSLGAGILLGFFCNVFYWIKLKAENIRLKSRLKNADKELTTLRSLPIKDL
jgi:lipopolysaccharide assembly protein A